MYVKRSGSIMKKNKLQTILLGIIILLSTSAINAQVIINEIGTTVDFNSSSKWVELKNTGSSMVDVSGLIFCIEPSYPTVGTRSILAGNSDYTIPPGGFLVVSWNSLGTNEGELGLYRENTPNFGDPANILDYIQYGADGNGRDDVAASAGIWSENEFVTTVESGQSYSFFPDEPGDQVDKWLPGSPTPGEENQKAETVSIEDELELADDFRLDGNFPNPFNPSTVIQFDLPAASRVTLEVFNIIGRKVMTLPAQSFSAGQNRQLRLDAANLTSGRYIYRLRAESNAGTIERTSTFTLIK